MIVRHSCDFPLCCNPKHLLLGTQADNMADMVARGRSRRGERHYNARLLTSEKVAAIRNDPRPNAQIAAEYGLSTRYVWMIKRGVRWRTAEA